ncbi:MAG: hypothetical protein AAF250_02000 [Pseudomonadota bacterium]
MRTGVAVALASALSVAACGDAVTEPASDAPEAAAVSLPEKTGNPERFRQANEAGACERDADGQTACLIQAFQLERCDSAAVLGSMFRENEAEATYAHRTAFGVDATCAAELREVSRKRGLRENDKGEFVLTREGGYRETLIFGLQISEDGSVVEWERTQQ